MTHTASATPPDQLPPLEQIARNVQSEIVRAGHAFLEIEQALGCSHAYASRRKSGREYAWTYTELGTIAEWLRIDRAVLLPGGDATVVIRAAYPDAAEFDAWLQDYTGSLLPAQNSH